MLSVRTAPVTFEFGILYTFSILLGDLDLP